MAADGTMSGTEPAAPQEHQGHGVPPVGQGRPPRVSMRTRRLRVVGLLIIVAGGFLLVSGWLWLSHEAAPSSSPGPQVVIEVAPGAGLKQVTASLQQQGVIPSALAYRIWSVFNSVPGVQPGAYAVQRGSGFSAVRTVLSGGPNVETLTVPPGFTVSEVADRLGQLPGHDASSFQALASSGSVASPWQPPGSHSLEGLLGTGTYVILPGESDRTLLRQMVTRFDALAARLDLAASSAALGRTPYEMVTIASIVQKEGVISKNLGPVARVILNRLDKGTPLQMDSTVLYAIGQDGGPVTAADLKIASPYNTYLHSGLPPTPTCLPSPAALEAALHPPDGSWLYFVVVGQDGTEAFSTTYAGQLANEALAAQRGLG